MPIFPPQGLRDDRRWSGVSDDERDYSLFCLEFCSRILDRRPDQREALEAAANHFTLLGYYADGLALDERLVRLRPADPGVLYNAACSLALVGRAAEAVAALNSAVEHGYYNHRHMAKDEDLAALRGDAGFLALLRRMREEE